MKIVNNIFFQITSLENLFLAWERFLKDKRKKADVQRFAFDLEQNLFQLHHELMNKTYQHGQYTDFYIRDPKVRHIHKAQVRDRVLHHAVFQILNPFYESVFIHNSFSCRVNKGTHRGVRAVESMIRRESRNYTKPCWAMKCDVQKFFNSVNHRILLETLKKRIADDDAMWLLREIIESFLTGQLNLFDPIGLPIGNLTSQLFANVYMNEFDQYVKQDLRAQHYARYTDDFIIVSRDRAYLDELLNAMRDFLKGRLSLILHPKKISIRRVTQGVDFLGYIILPHHRQLRTTTKHRIVRKIRHRAKQFRGGIIDEITLTQSVQSYLGVLSHANAHRFSEDLKNNLWFYLTE